MRHKNLLTRLGEAIDDHRAATLAEFESTLPPISVHHRSKGWRWLLHSPGNVVFTILMLVMLLWAQNAGAISLGAPLATTTSTAGIAYQGRLADKNGAPLTQTVNMIFRLYAAASGGSPLWEEQWTGANSVQVSDGLFNVMLGSLTPIPQAVITGNSNLFLGITVGTDSEMSPRVQLGSVPFATQALTVPDGSITSEKLAPYLFEVQHASTTQHDWQVTTCSGQDNSTGYIVIPGLSLNFNLHKPQTVLVDFTGLGVHKKAGGAIHTNIFVDGMRSTAASGTGILSGCRNSSNDTGLPYCTLSNSAAIPLPTGSHTVDIRAYCDSDGPAHIWAGSMWALTLP